MNQLKTVLLLGILSAILVGIGGFIGPNALAFSLVLAVVMNLGAYFFSDRIVLAMHHAQEIPPASLFSTHPDMAERIRRLRAMAMQTGRWSGVPHGAASRL
jgi:heat shock protein HtpX